MRVTSDVWIFAALTGCAATVWLYPGLKYGSWVLSVVGIAALLGLALPALNLLSFKSSFPGDMSPVKESNSGLKNVLMQPTAPAFALSGLLCGIWWGIFNVQNAVDWQFPQSQWREPVNVTLVVEEIVNQDPHRIRIDGRLIAVPESWPQTFPGVPVRARVHWYGYDGALPKPGETWLLNVRLRPASGLLNQSGFNYQVYLLRQNIRVTGSVSAGERISEPLLRSFRQQVFDFYQRYEQTNEGVLQFTDLMLALSIGERQWMSDERWRILQQTGVAHLMAISGLHLTFVFGVALVLLKTVLVLLSETLRSDNRQPDLIPLVMVLSLCVAFFYAALAGFAVATLRALVLIAVFVVVRLKTLYAPPLRVFLRAVSLVIFLDPFAWLDIGFWLSAGAVLAIFCWQWRVPQHTRSIRFSKIRQLWRLEIMLTLMLLPLSLLFFHGMSLIAPITNSLVVPVFSFLVLPLCLLIVALILSGSPTGDSRSYQLAEFVMQVNDQLLSVIWVFLVWCSELTYAWIPGYQKAIGLAVVALICIWFLPLAWRARVLLQSALCASVLLSVHARDTVEFAVHVLDVGQGSAIVVEQNGYALVFDAGPAYPGGFDTGAATVIPFIRFKNLKPDYLVLSHPHRDHTGGADSLRSAFPRMQVFSDLPGELTCSWGQQWVWRNVRVKALAPMPGPSFGPNNDSCVIQLTYPAAPPDQTTAEWRSVKVLLTGDIQQLTELRMVGRYGGGFESDVLMVPHHGSSTSSQKEFLDLVKPTTAVASRGYLNQFSMPRDDVQLRYKERGIRVYDTALHGQVSLTYNSGTFDVETYRGTLAPWWFNQQQRDAIW